MNHRYGRHGANAWCYLREHRFKHSTHPLVSESCVTVIHVHIKFIYSERIFVVALDENGMQVNNANGDNIVDADPTTPPMKRLKPDPLGQLKHRAQIDGARKAEQDLANLGEPSTEKELRSFARLLGLTYAAEHVTVEMAEGRDATELGDIYVDAFVEGYCKGKERITGNRDLPDESIRRIKRKAREDKALDLTLNKQLSSRQITYQAIVRVLETLHLDTQNRTDYLAQIEKFADLYIDEYTDHKEVEKSQHGLSNPFQE